MSDFQARLKDLSPAKRALLEKLLLQQSSTEQQIPPRPTSAANTLSRSEQRLWFVDRLERDHPFYNMPLAARVHGNVDRSILSNAVEHLVQRHESLRTTYQLDDGSPVRVVHDSTAIPIEWIDLDGEVDESNAIAEAKRQMRSLGRDPFNLEDGPLLRVVVFRITESQHIVLLSMHHIISDGWSMIVMLRELTSVYDAFAQGQASPLPPLAIQYADFAHWQNERLTETHIESQMEYWREQLDDAPPVLDFPTDWQRPAIQDFDGATAELELSTELTAKVNALARVHQTTPFVILIAAQAVLIGRYANQNDLVLGTASAGRGHPEIESQIGFFVNTLALRFRLNDELTFSQLVAQAHDTVNQAHAHADVPFERLVDEFAAGRDRSFSPIFQSAMVMQNLPRDFQGAGGAKVEPMLVDNGTAKYDLTFFLWQESDRLVGHVEYRTRLFKQSTIQRLIDSFHAVLTDATNNPDVTLNQIKLLSDSEFDRVTQQFNQTGKPLTGPQLLHQVFEQHVDTQPQKVAVVDGGRKITYCDLNTKANQVANSLIQAGIKSEDAVVIALPRSVELAATVLGVLKAGGTLVLVDSEFPEARIKFVRDTVSAGWLIDSSNVLEFLNGPTESVVRDISPRDRAYIIFTSGSTGTAKGVEVEHRSITNFVKAQIERMGVQKTDRTSFSFSPAFDGALSELFYSIGCGATCVVVHKATMGDPQALASFLNAEQVTVCKFPPAILSMLDESKLPSIRLLASAGDKLTGDLAGRWTRRGRRFLNGYGPTEVTVGCTMMVLDDSSVDRPPIGSPMRNMRVYILDSQRQPVPIGAIGEIYVGGVGVARGYFNQPALTEEKFLPDPFVAATDEDPPRMYRTGDLGRWQEDGNLEFMGRVDDQLSLRGYRIEPGEIAAAIEQMAIVQQAVVVQRDDNDVKQLVAYVVPTEDSSDTQQIRELEQSHVDAWKDLGEQSHRAAPVALDPSFNVIGWISTYTNKPIPSVEMQEWTDRTVSRILELQPKNVLEIGCGTGLLMLRIAEHCQSYVGVDLLESALENIRQALRTRDGISNKVELHQAPADDFQHVAGRKFDTIILNSVVQYFPSGEYLSRVIQLAATHLTPDGKIFVGDVRNLRLQRALATSVELFQAPDKMPIAKLQQQVTSHLEHEEELLVDPFSLNALLNSHTNLKSCRILLKDAEAANELSRFRYDAILSFESVPTATNNLDLDYSTQYAPNRVLDMLKEQQSSSLSIRGIPNPRVVQDCRLADQINAPAISNAGDLRSIDDPSSQGIDPNEYHRLSHLVPYRVDAFWNSECEWKYDVRLTRVDETVQSSPTNTASPNDAMLKCNEPLASRKERGLTKRIRDKLRDVLPSYMLPSAIVLMDELPQTVNGKVDRNSLPAPLGRPAWAGDFIGPRTDTEATICQIWEDVLDVHPIGVTDDFFELGGHSMLAVRMIAEIDKTCDRQLPLSALFKDPTIASLADLVDNPDSLQSSTIVPLRVGENGTTAAPLFCVHPAGGTVFCYMDLVDQMPIGRAVYGVQAVGIDGLAAPHESLVEMGRHYAQAIIETQPTGPIHITGWSLGGNIAFEVARQLREDNRDVRTVALLDSGLLSPETELRDEDFLPLLMALFPAALNVSLDELRDKDHNAQVQFFAERAQVAGIVPNEEIDKAGNIFSVFQANVKAVHQYQAASFAGDLHLFRPVDQSKTNQLFDDPVLGWRAVSNRVHLLEVGGDHAHMLQEPAVASLAAKLDAIMRESENA